MSERQDDVTPDETALEAQVAGEQPGSDTGSEAASEAEARTEAEAAVVAVEAAPEPEPSVVVVEAAPEPEPSVVVVEAAPETRTAVEQPEAAAGPAPGQETVSEAEPGASRVEPVPTPESGTRQEPEPELKSELKHELDVVPVLEPEKPRIPILDWEIERASVTQRMRSLTGADAPTADAPTADAATADALPGDAATADALPGDAATADALPGDAVTADAPITGVATADALSGDAPTVEAPTAGAPTGDAPTSDTPAEDAPTEVMDAATVAAAASEAPTSQSEWTPTFKTDEVPAEPMARRRSIWAPPVEATTTAGEAGATVTGEDVDTSELLAETRELPLPEAAPAPPPPVIPPLARPVPPPPVAVPPPPLVVPSSVAVPPSPPVVPPDLASSATTVPTVHRHAKGSEGGRAAPKSGAASRARPQRRTLMIGLVAAGVVVLSSLYVGALWLWADRVPPGTTVAGVEIGGMQEGAAVDELGATLGVTATEELPVAVGEKRTTLVPTAAGLELDARATVESVTGFGLEPTRLWRQLFGAGAVEPISRIDRTALTAAIEGITETLSTPYVDGTLAFVEGELQVTAPADGVTVDVPAAADLLATSWLTRARPIELPTVVAPALIGQAELDSAVTELATPLTQGPVTVQVDGQVAELPVEVLAGAASFVPEDGQLVLQMNGQMLVDAVLARTTNLLTAASDASFTFANGQPTIVAGVSGTTIDPEALAQAVTDAAASDRTAEVALVETDPAESTAELEALGITQVVSEFSTPLTSEPRRTQNIANAAGIINGQLIRPGETFNLEQALGPIDAAHGFVPAGAIIDGVHTDAMGGGLCQIATTTFNSAYYAGMEIVERHAHSEYFSRYPAGLDAAIFTPTVNMQWKNNTPYGALMQGWVQDGRVWFRIWSTPYWTVESSVSGRSAVRAPGVVYSQAAGCEAQSAGNSGFTVTATRRVLLNGVEQSVDTFSSTYKPQNAIVCGPAPGG
jgi:vancomycin resistance protein YoaR